MAKQIITTDRIENILSGKELVFIDNSGVQPRILVKECEFGFFASNNSIKIPYDLIFEGCNFMQTFYLNGISNKSIFFKNCSCYEDLSLGIICDELHITYSKFSIFLSLGGCKINKVICILMTSSFRVSRGEYGQFSVINYDKNNTLSLDFNAPTFKEYLEIISQDDKIKNIFKITYFKNLIAKKIKFLNLIIESKFDIQGEESNIENFDFQKIIFKEVLKVFDGKFGTLSILESSFEKNLELNKGNFKIVKIDKLEKVGTIEIQSPVYIDEFELASTTKPFTLLLNSSSHNKIYLKNLNSSKDNFICFNQIRVNDLMFNKFINFGNIYLINLKQSNNPVNKDSTIFILNSDLGKTTMMDCNLENYRLDFHSSKISEVFLAGTKMPSHNKINRNSGDKEQKRLALSQIKKIYENRGDSLSANEYYAEEMKTYMSQLFSNFKISKIPELLNLLFNYISNNFGQNWLLALISTILIVFISLELFTRSLNFPITDNIFEALKWKMGLMFEYINPTTKIKDFADSLGLAHEKLTSNSKFIFGITRFVVIPYFVYQLIAAFRKHGKKS
ncbi:hypothetical protein [Emticicia sp. SJ17W-69]|uniref:hypothetical protein n=1 Tax=Emticicia sp. SJ17W-69 TaxID=3421657 RepID=UPI003EBCAFB7